METCSSVQRQSILVYATACKDLEDIVLSETSQPQERCHRFHPQGSCCPQTTDTESREVAAGAGKVERCQRLMGAELQFGEMGQSSNGSYYIAM